MKKTNKHIIPSLREFLNYINNKMSSENRNTFEKILQKDAFAEDAMEGLSIADQKKLKKDIDIINARITGSKNKSYNIYITGIAAAIGLFIITSLTYLAIDRLSKSKDEFQLSYKEDDAKKIEEELMTLAEEDADTIFVKREKLATGSAMEREKKLAPAPVVECDQVAEIDIERDEEEIVEDQLFFSVEANAGGVPTSAVIDTDKVAEEKTEVSAIDIAQESGKESKLSRQSLPKSYKSKAGYSAPEPELGMNHYNKYIEENAIIPDSIDLASARLIIRFIVSEKGEIENMEVLRSPSPTLSIIALKLIKNGPKWNPAKINEKLIEEEVILNINFMQKIKN